MAIVNMQVRVLDKTRAMGSSFFEGSIIIREHGSRDISYNFGCKEPYQKVPQIFFANGDEIVFVPEKPITDDYKKSLSNWQQALLFLLNDVYPYILKLKYGKGQISYLIEHKQIDIPEEILNDLAS